MPEVKKDEQIKSKCPGCSKFDEVRIVPTEPGYDRRLVHYVCDRCLIGWYLVPGAWASTTFRYNRPEIRQAALDAAKAAYVAAGRPVKDKRKRR